MGAVGVVGEVYVGLGGVRRAGEGKHVSDEGGGCGGCGWMGRPKMCLLWAVGAVRAGGAVVI